MNFNIVSDIPLYYSPSFLNEVERVITKNTDIGTSKIVQEIGLFISRLNQGIKEFSKYEFDIFDGPDSYSYTIDNVGTLLFSKLGGNSKFNIFINDIKWEFDGYYLYADLTESANKQKEAILSLMERVENLHKRPPVK